MIKPLIVL